MILLFATQFCVVQNVEIETKTEYEKDFKVRFIILWAYGKHRIRLHLKNLQIIL